MNRGEQSFSLSEQAPRLRPLIGSHLSGDLVRITDEFDVGESPKEKGQTGHEGCEVLDAGTLKLLDGAIMTRGNHDSIGQKQGWAVVHHGIMEKKYPTF